MKSHDFARLVLTLADKPLRVWTGHQFRNCDIQLGDHGGQYIEFLLIAKPEDERPDAKVILEDGRPAEPVHPLDKPILTDTQTHNP